MCSARARVLCSNSVSRYEVVPDVLNIAETCAASVSVADLQAFATGGTDENPLDVSKKLTYGAIRGSDSLRGRVAALYVEEDATKPPLPASRILTTQGAIAANFLVFYALLGPGDHVICVYPAYQQLYGVPQSLGAQVSLWRLKKENGFIPDVSELDALVQSNTKMIVLNNPNNPTGATTPEPVLRTIVEFAKARGVIVLCDEVYRPLFHSLPEGEAVPPSILSFGYEKTISTSSMSKAWSLAGIRLGWIASRDESIIEAVAEARDYTAISVGQLDDQIAGYALSDAVRPGLMRRNLQLASTNLALLDDFVQAHKSVCNWVKPTAGTTAFIQFTNKGMAVDDEAFCLDVLDKTKAMFLPGKKCFGHGQDFEGYVRIGYVNKTTVLKEALDRLGKYVDQGLSV